MIDRTWRDVRYALRGFRLNPGYFAITVLTLAVGIGANTAIFSVVKGVLLDELPFTEPERIVGIWQYDLGDGSRARVTPGNFRDLRDLTDVFESAAAFSFTDATLLVDGTPETVSGGRVSSGYLRTLGVAPIAGRDFRADDEVVGGPSIVMISEELWTRRFARDPGIVGDTIELSGNPFEVIGVIPRGVYPTYATVGGTIPFTPHNHDILVPLRFAEDFYSTRRSHILGAVGRLADGVSFEQGNEAVEALGTALREQFPIMIEGLRIESLQEDIVGGSRTALLVLMGTVGVVLLIATTNVASIMLARADARRGETAVRAALGAGRAELVRQSVTEALMLAACGAAAGVGVALVSLDSIRDLVPFQIPRMNEVAIDGQVLGFSVAVALVAGVVLGAAPAILATRPAALAQVRQGARGLTADGARRRTHGLMVAAQSAMAVMLVVGAGLLVRTFLEIRAIDPGFSGDGVVTVSVSMPGSRYPSFDEILRFYDRLEDNLEADPSVETVAFGYDHPLSKSWTDSFRIEGAPPLAPGASMGASFRPVSPGYFEAAAIPLIRGRTFEDADDAERALVAVVNRSFENQFFDGADALGERIRLSTVERRLGSDAELWLEIVGVVSDVRFNGPTDATEPAMYVSIPQVPMGSVVLLARPQAPGLDIAGTVRAAIWDLDPELPVDDLSTLDRKLADAVARERFNMLLVGLFALLALGLAGLGIYGLIARLVHMQTREIGIRVALGAQRGEVLHLVLGAALVPVLLGGIIGIVGAAGFARVAESLLYGIGALDPISFLATPVILLATALLAGYLPARRATRIDPIDALRQE